MDNSAEQVGNNCASQPASGSQAAPAVHFQTVPVTPAEFAQGRGPSPPLTSHPPAIHQLELALFTRQLALIVTTGQTNGAEVAANGREGNPI